MSALFIRGPGMIWPETIYKYDPESPLQCQALSLTSSWFLSDLNILSIVPVSLLWMLNSLRSPRVLLGVRVAVVICWILPIVELVILSVAVSNDFLTTEFSQEYKRCWVGYGNDSWTNFVDNFNMTVFNILPLLLHIVFWSVTLFRIREAETFSKNLKKAGFVISAALVTWLPYFIVYAIMRKYPVEGYSLVLVAFYISIITNPIFITWDKLAFRRGCIQCCQDNCCCGSRENLNVVVRNEIQYPTTPTGNYMESSTMDSI
eukprot:sb/3468446/